MVGRRSTLLTMSTETDTARVDPRELPADSFTDSDLARIQLVGAIESAAASLGQYGQMVGEDLAQAGDYARRADTLHTFDAVLDSVAHFAAGWWSGSG